LRKLFIDNKERDNLSIDPNGFGKFTIVNDPDADVDSLYPRKIIFEQTGMLQ